MNFGKSFGRFTGTWFGTLRKSSCHLNSWYLTMKYMLLRFKLTKSHTRIWKQSTRKDQLWNRMKLISNKLVQLHQTQTNHFGFSQVSLVHLQWKIRINLRKSKWMVLKAVRLKRYMLQSTKRTKKNGCWKGKLWRERELRKYVIAQFDDWFLKFIINIKCKSKFWSVRDSFLDLYFTS